MRVRLDGTFTVAAAILVGTEVEFASGTCKRMTETPFWRCDAVDVDADARARIFEEVWRLAPKTAMELSAQLVSGFADSKSRFSEDGGIFRPHGVVFQRLGRFKAMMIGPIEAGATAGLGWTLRRID